MHDRRRALDPRDLPSQYRFQQNHRPNRKELAPVTRPLQVQVRKVEQQTGVSLHRPSAAVLDVKDVKNGLRAKSYTL